MEIKNNYLQKISINQCQEELRYAIKPQIIEKKQVFQNPQSPYDASNKRLQCVDCGSLFAWNSEQKL